MKKLLFALPLLAALSLPAQAQVITCKSRININTSSDAQLRAIGLGPKMIAEVKEYRPFRNAAHVKKELGKYMNAGSMNKLLTCITVK